MSPSFAAENEFHRALASALAQMRTERHTSQGTLAGELGLDQAAVSRVETGNRRLTAGETFAWMEALGLTSQQTAETLRELWDQHGGRPPGFWSGT